MTMDLKLMATVFAIVFVAELGDKTQLATFLFASKEPQHLLTVFVGASLALVLASGIGVLAGGFLSQFVSEKTLSLIAGAGFILIGVWTIWSTLQSA